jgi:hypothetical protein
MKGAAESEAESEQAQHDILPDSVVAEKVNELSRRRCATFWLNGLPEVVELPAFRLRSRDETTSRIREVTLVYLHEADI